jgi:hypothetical protein
MFASHCAPPVSLTPLANFPLVSMTRAVNFAAGTDGVIDTTGKFAIGVNNKGSKFAASVNDNGANCHLYQRHWQQISHGCHWSAEEHLKNPKTTFNAYLGIGLSIIIKNSSIHLVIQPLQLWLTDPHHIRDVLGNKCTGHHNLKRVKIREIM